MQTPRFYVGAKPDIKAQRNDRSQDPEAPSAAFQCRVTFGLSLAPLNFKDRP